MSTTIAPACPMPGDAVRIKKPATGWWSSGVKDGAIGIIDGQIGRQRDAYPITFNYSAFRGRSHAKSPGPEYVSCSGGPGSIFTPVDELTATGETVEVCFWRWKSYPCAGGGEHYALRVPLWEWAPKARDPED